MNSAKYNNEEGKIASQPCGVFGILNIHITLKKQLSNKKGTNKLQDGGGDDSDNNKKW
jgi:hypothetical protein